MSKRKILIQLDGDDLPSVFDRVVAVDAGAEEIFSYGGITPEQVRDLVYGAMFTRGPKDLKSTAVFVGGSDVGAGEKIFAEVQKAFFGPLRVSLLLDCSGANTTAAAAVVAASRHVSLEGRKALVLGSTGSVGRRVARLLARKGAEVRVASRDVARATEVAEEIRGSVDGVRIQPFATGEVDGLRAALDGVEVVVAAGGPGVELLSLEERERLVAQPMGHSLQVLIDLNAVPPVGIAGIEPTDAAVERDGVTTYGAIGVGGTKMKIHKAAVARLFEANDLVLDAEEVLDIGLAL